MDEPFENLYEELKEEIKEIKNNTGGGSSGDGVIDIVTTVDPTKEHTNEQVYGAKALDETFVAIDEMLQEKQAELVSGDNIMTINGKSILGSGDITIGGGGEIPQNVETTDNKVTKITENSTNEEYPSAKAVYELVDGIEFSSGSSSSGGLNAKAITLLIQILQEGIYSTNVSGKIEQLQTALTQGSSGGGSSDTDTPTTTDDITVTDGIMTIISVGSEISVTDSIMTIL